MVYTRATPDTIMSLGLKSLAPNEAVMYVHVKLYFLKMQFV